MKVFYAIMSWIMLVITILFVLWATTESHSWVWLVEVWAAVFAIITIALYVFKKKILSLSTGKGLLAMAAIFLAGSAIGDTFYVVDLYRNLNGYYSPTNQLILCIMLWITAAVCGYGVAKKKV